MLRTRIVSFIALFATTACDKSSPDSAPPDSPHASPGAATQDEVPDEVPTEAAQDDLDEPEETGAEQPAASADHDATPVVPTEPAGPRAVPADPGEGLTEPTNMATVRLEIKDENGKVVKDSPKVLPWDERFRIPVEVGNSVHEVDVEVSRDGKDVEVVLSYLLEGQELVRNFRLDTKPNKRELVRIEGGIALAITIGSKTIKPKPQKERDKVDTPTDADPLKGAER